MAARVLTINAGSSSVKFAIYVAGGATPTLHGKLDRIGSPHTSLSWSTHGERTGRTVAVDSAHAATRVLVDWLEEQRVFTSITAVGHRVVHGLMHREPARITPDLLAELRGTIPYAPDHLPLEIALVEAFAERRPDLTQIACFDTAFHADMPRMAQLLPMPRRYDERGVRRYGFHGLSYAYLIEELARVAGQRTARGRVILAHLGNGASLAALQDGRSMDTSMGFTPASGLVMSTRTGDVDPGIVWFLAQTEQMTAAQFHQMVNQESGLLGVSETSSDMRDLLAREASDVRAAEAVAMFCYQAKKWVGAFAAVLGGLDTLVFSGGIGERSAPIRARMCDGLAFLGIQLDATRNGADEAVISADDSRVTVRVIPTDEELMIARSAFRLLGLDPSATGADP